VFFLIILLPLERVYVTKIFGVNIRLAEWMGLICIIIFFWNFIVKPRKRMFAPQILLPLFIFIFVNIIFLLLHLHDLIHLGSFNDFNSPGFRSLKVVGWCIYSVFLAIAVSYSINDKTDLRKTIMVFLWVPVSLCIISLISMFAHLFGIKFLTWSLIGRQEFVGVKGTFSEPSYLSNYLSVILPVAVLIFILRVYRLGSFFTILACFSLLLASYFSFSTTGLAGMTLMVFLIPFAIRRYHLSGAAKSMRYLVILIIAFYIIFLVGVLFNINLMRVTILNYFQKVITPESRAAARLMGYNMFRDHPFVGFGPGNWAWHAEQEYAQEVMKRLLIKPSYNCLYWEILVDLGLVGFSIFVWFFLTFFRQLAASIRRTDDAFLRALSVGFIVGFIILLGEYYVAFNFYRTHVWAFLGIAMAVIRLAKEDERKKINA
jgi:O-antigen ligase